MILRFRKFFPNKNTNIFFLLLALLSIFLACENQNTDNQSQKEKSLPNIKYYLKWDFEKQKGEKQLSKKELENKQSYYIFKQLKTDTFQIHIIENGNKSKILEYENEKLIYEKKLLNNKILAEINYFPNKKIIINYSKGQKVSEKEYVDEILQKEIKYSSNKQIDEIITYKHHPNGNLKHKQTYNAENELSGISIEYSPEGDKIAEKYYTDGLKDKQQNYYDAKQRIIRKEIYQKGELRNYTLISYKDGIIDKIENYNSENIRDGESYYFNSDSHITRKEIIKEGELQNSVIYDYSDNFLKSEISYNKQGKKDGYSKFYKNGELIKIESYANGLKNGFFTFFENGRKVKELFYRSSKEIKTTIFDYYKNGKRKSITTYKNNQKNGPSYLFNESGKKTVEKYYQKGVLTLSKKFIYENGILTKEIIENHTENEVKTNIYSKEGKMVKSSN